eukprot:403342305
MEIDQSNKPLTKVQDSKPNIFKAPVMKAKKKKAQQIVKKISEKSKDIHKGESYKARLESKFQKREKKQKNKK